MKRLLFVLIAAVCIFTSCDFSKSQEDEGTKLVVPQWVDNVYSVSLETVSEQGFIAVHKADTCPAYKTFTGPVKLKVKYDSLSDEEKKEYLGYGILDGSTKPFKVFVNGIEVENENPKATIPAVSLVTFALKSIS